jgi:hypothetical protein
VESAVVVSAVFAEVDEVSRGYGFVCSEIDGKVACGGPMMTLVFWIGAGPWLPATAM